MAGTICEAAREIPVLAETDILVAGGGVAGCAAAWAAAKTGAKTILIERNGCLGGVATASLMANIGNLFVTPEGLTKVRGFAMAVLDRAAAVGAASPHWKHTDVPGCVIDSERFKVVLIEMLEEAGVTILTHALGARPILDGSTVRGAFIESKSGRQAIVCKAVVDCTGEADLAAQSGAETRFRAASMVRTATTLFKMCNVDMEAFIAWLERDPAGFPAGQDHVRDLDSFKRNYRERGIIFFPHIGTFGREWPFLNNLMESTGYHEAAKKDCEGYCDTKMGMYGLAGPGCLAVNSNVYAISDLDIRNLSRFELHAQKMCYQTAELMKKHVPGFANAHVAHIGVDLGVRASRYIVGRETLSSTQMSNTAGPTHCDSVVATPPVRLSFKKHNKFLAAYTFDVPFGITVPKGCSGILVGSAKSVSTEPAGCIRGMSGCMVCGQAAGAAAGLAAKAGIFPADVPIRKLQRELLRQDVHLGDNDRLQAMGLA